MIIPDDNICGRCTKAEFGCEGLCAQCEKALRGELDYSWKIEPDAVSHEVPRYRKVWCPFTKTYKQAHYVNGEPNYR